MMRGMLASRRRLILTTTSLLLSSGATAFAETDITLGGELGMSAVVGLSKGGEAFALETAASIKLDVDHSTDYGLLLGGSLTLNTIKDLQIDAYEHTDAHGVQEHRIFRLTAPGPTNIVANVFAVSGGAIAEETNIVAVKINSDWLSLGATQSASLFPLPHAMAENVCKLAGRLADDMIGRAATFAVTPATPTAAPVFRTKVGNGLFRDDEIVLANAGSTGKYAPAGQFLAKRQIWATNTISTNVVIGKPTAVIPRPQPIGARVSVHPYAALVGVTSRPGAAAAVFQTRFPSVTITPDQVDAGGVPQVVNQSTLSQSATVLFNPGTDEQNYTKVNNAQVFVGPFAEIRTIGSSEKMVTGAVCFEELPSQNETRAFLQPVSKMFSHTSSSIFVEGGFGRVTISTEDHAGMIDSDGPWGDLVSLEAEDNLILSANTLGSLFGIQGTIAATPVSGTRTLNTIAGAKIDLGGISFATDVMFDVDVVGVLDAWQLEAALNPFSTTRLAFVLDSENDWWIEAEYGSSAFALKAQAGIPNDASPDQPVYWWVTSELDVNGATLSAEYDQQGVLALGLDTTIGAGGVYARVEQDDDIVNLRFGTTLDF